VSTPGLVGTFYERIWNAGELAAAAELLTPDFSFRGSLGDELRGEAPFLDYVRAVRGALGEYRCEILECVAEAIRRSPGCASPARTSRPSGGSADRGRSLLGAALFRFEGGAIADLWVLGDLVGLMPSSAARPARRWPIATFDPCDGRRPRQN